MKILLATPDYPPPPGGIQTLTKNLERGIESIGHKTQLIHADLDRWERLKNAIPRLAVSHPIDLIKWPELNYTYREAKKTIRNFEPDIVHSTHLICWPAIKAAAEAGIPGITSIHGIELSQTWRTETASGLSNAFHTVSKFTEELTQSVTGVKDTKTYVIPPSISQPHELPSESPDGHVFTIARHDERKNIPSLIEAWGHVSDDLRQKHGLIIAGEGEQSDFINSKTAGDTTIRVVGRVNEEQKAELFEEAAAFALTPYRNDFDVEGFGIVYIESQAYGTPVIGSSTGGIPEAVGDAGLLVDSPNDVNEIALCLERLLTDYELRDSCRRAMENRLPKFDIRNVSQQHIEAYRDIVENHN